MFEFIASRMYGANGFFIVAFFPQLAFARLPEEIGIATGMPDWKYSITVTWLLWSMSICFGRYDNT